MNFAVAQLRTTLGDSADANFHPDLAKGGYQFLAPVSEPVPDAPIAPAPQATRRSILSSVAAAGVAASALGGIAAALWGSRTKELRIAVARFQNETGNPALDRFADTSYGVIGNAAILRHGRIFQDLDKIASDLKVRYVIVGQVQQDGPRVRVLAHLIRLPEKTHLIVSRVELETTASKSRLAGTHSQRSGQPARLTAATC